MAEGGYEGCLCGFEGLGYLYFSYKNSYTPKCPFAINCKSMSKANEVFAKSKIESAFKAAANPIKVRISCSYNYLFSFELHRKYVKNHRKKDF